MSVGVNVNFGALKNQSEFWKSLGKVLKLVSEKGYEPCMQQNTNLNVVRLQHESRVEELQQVNAKLLKKTLGK